MLIKKKILNVVSVYLTIPYFFRNQFIYFADKYDISVGCSPSADLQNFADRNLVHAFEFDISRSISPFRDIVTIFKLVKLIRREKYDVVVGHTPKGALLSMIAAFISRTPKRIFFRHGLVYETATGFKKNILIFIERFTSFLSTKVICVSPYLIQRSIEDKLTSKEKMEILNIGSCNGVDCKDMFNPENLDPKKIRQIKFDNGILENDFVVGFVGRLVNDKGIFEIVEVFKLLQDKGTKVKLLLLGSFDDRDALNYETKNEILNNPFIIQRDFIESDIQYYFAMMQIFLMPTRREGLGNSILEASAMQIPVISSSHTGSRDAILNDITGYAVIPKIELLFEKVNFLIEHPEIRKAMGIAGRKFVKVNFDQQIIWNEIEKKVYN